MKDHSTRTPEETAAAVARFVSERDLFARSLGIELLELQPGACQAAMTLAPHMVNGLAMPHGAVIFALADFAFAAACNAYGRAAVALSMDVHFVASPPPESRLIVQASEVHCGRRTGLYRMVVTTEDGKLIAELHGMAYRKDHHFLE
jgi:acyl-CoA thioesterase